MTITSETVLLKMNEIQNKGGQPIGHWHELRRWLLEDEQVQENFFDAVANDINMSAEQKEYWLEKSTELEEYKQGNSDMKLIIQQFHSLLGVETSTEAFGKVAELMREETEAERLLSKCLGHLRTCSDPEGDDLFEEVLAAFRESDD